MMLAALAAVMSLAVQCHPPEPPEPPGPVDPTVIVDSSYDFSAEGGTVTLTMTMTEAWTANAVGGGTWCTLSKKSGKAGEAKIVIKVKPNDTGAARSCTVKISSKSTVGTIVINQEQNNILKAEPAKFEVPAEGGEYTPEITANVEFEVMFDADWIVWEDGKITVDANESEEPREAVITLQGTTLSVAITVAQDGVVPPEPHDELDGIATQMQTHTEGIGIPIVLMGDAFSHDQIEDGTYAALMQKAADAFFTIEPYATFRDLFDIYTVTVVSGYYEDFSSSGSTTLGTWFGDGAYVGGDHVACQEYAQKAVPREIMDDVLIVVLLNRETHSGRCYTQLINNVVGDDTDDVADDCAHGVALAYLALGTDDDDFTGLVRHEAGGHGFGRLADEYVSEGTGAIPLKVVDTYKSVQTLNHAYMNVDFTSDPETVLWSRFLQDERYQYEDLGVFEGAGTYETGIWRPSQTSIMATNEGGFNAPSREAIFYRMHKLAFGREWEYDFETFVEYDAVNRRPAPAEEP